MVVVIEVDAAGEWKFSLTGERFNGELEI